MYQLIYLVRSVSVPMKESWTNIYNTDTGIKSFQTTKAGLKQNLIDIGLPADLASSVSSKAKHSNSYYHSYHEQIFHPVSQYYINVTRKIEYRVTYYKVNIVDDKVYGHWSLLTAAQNQTQMYYACDFDGILMIMYGLSQFAQKLCMPASGVYTVYQNLRSSLLSTSENRINQLIKM